jgi:hypothetical protein
VIQSEVVAGLQFEHHKPGWPNKVQTESYVIARLAIIHALAIGCLRNKIYNVLRITFMYNTAITKAPRNLFSLKN